MNIILKFVLQRSLLSGISNNKNQTKYYENQTFRNFNGLVSVYFLKKLLKWVGSVKPNA